MDPWEEERFNKRNALQEILLLQGSVKYPSFWESNKQQMYGNFEGFPLQYCIVWVGNVMTLVLVGQVCDLKKRLKFEGKIPT